MTIDTDLARDLERAVPHLPTASATTYLASGRRARRRRRVYAGAATVAVLGLTGGAALSVLDDPAPSSVVRTPAGETSADGIPGWAQEYGNHGPVSIYPNGELWVAPDARVIRQVKIPAGTFDKPVVSAYVTESEFEGDVWWSYVSRTTSATDDKPFGIMEEAGSWTTDFDLWVDYATAVDQGRPRFSDRLVRFAGDSSEQLVPLPGAEIVDQRDDVDLSPGFQNHPRTSVAQVTYGGKTWFVIGSGARSGSTFYTPYQAEVTSASDIAGFLDYLDAQVSDSE
jgi:hypothetical protein